MTGHIASRHRMLASASLAAALFAQPFPVLAQAAGTTAEPMPAAPTTEESPAGEGAAEAAPSTRQMLDREIAVLQGLDKITARVRPLEVPVGETRSFGELYLRPRACRVAGPEEEPEAAVFLEIWEIQENEQSRWVYSGWMFASSPALAAMDHPVYDIWLLECRNPETSSDSETEE